MENKIVNIIGAGLAGTECAYTLSKAGIKVKLYEMKPIKFSPAHKSEGFAELVCSNSLKSNLLTNACGLLKEEMRMYGSLMMEAADNSSVDAGQALAVDREKFSEYITNKIKSQKNIEVITGEVKKLDFKDITVIATGPLTSEELSKEIAILLGSDYMYFYDAAAPIVDASTIDMNIAYEMDRYSEKEGGDYINLPMNKEQYQIFFNELLLAQRAERKEFDKLNLFEGCMPIEEMAVRGEKTLLFGTLKPVGLDNPRTGEKNYAVVQLRSENKEKTMYNMVGFQTSLKFAEQKRVFSLIPGLENAKFERYGVMHRNTYINGPMVFEKNYRLRDNKNIYFAGQITGVEGYVESAASGLTVALDILSRIKGHKLCLSEETMMGSLEKHTITYNKNYQPMNANFGILKPLDKKIKDKKERYSELANISLKRTQEVRDGI